MSRWRAALGLVLVLNACTALPPGSGKVVSTVRTENPSAPPPAAAAKRAFAVLVDESSGDSTYRVNVISVDGSVVATADAIKRPPHDTWLDLPYASTTSQSVYYLNAGSAVMRLPLDGSTPIKIGELPGAANWEDTFAVSPDETKIAVSVLDFNRSPVADTLYIGSFPGLELQKIFVSSSDYVWPIAWHGGLLVLAHAYGVHPDLALKAAPGRDNPYWAISYHLVDPNTADRVVLMGSCTVSGPLSPAGSACIQGGAMDWQGNVGNAWSTHDWGAISGAASLSPDGSMMAAADPDQPGRIDIWRQDGSIATYVEGPGPGEWAGWLDATHVFLPATSTLPPRILTLGQGPSSASYINASGFYAARLPTDIT